MYCNEANKDMVVGKVFYVEYEFITMIWVKIKSEKQIIPKNGFLNHKAVMLERFLVTALIK